MSESSISGRAEILCVYSAESICWKDFTCPDSEDLWLSQAVELTFITLTCVIDKNICRKNCLLESHGTPYVLTGPEFLLLGCIKQFSVSALRN